jgi:hypothetical protein
LPTQDMVLGCYYVTTGMHDLNDSGFESPRNSRERESRYFASVQQVKACYDRGDIALHTPIWVKYDGRIHNSSSESHAKLQEKALEIHVSVYGQVQVVFSDRFVSYSSGSGRNNSARGNLQQSSPSSRPSGLPMSEQPTTTLVRTTPGRVLFHLLLDSVPRRTQPAWLTAQKDWVNDLSDK